MAVRRADFDRSPVGEEWRRHVSEDVGLTRAIQRLGLGIAFAPGAIVASPEDWERAEVLEWVVRQAALTRSSLPRLFRFAQGVYGLSAFLFVGGVALLAAGPSLAARWAGLLFLAPVLTSLPRAWLRERLVRRALPAARGLGPAQRARQLACSLAVPWFMLWVLGRARRVGRIAWRGREYLLPEDIGHVDGRARAR
jgi:hypothetical protein